MYRHSPVGVRLRHPTRPRGAEIKRPARPGLVTVTAEPGELILHAFGRELAQVELDGAEADIAALQAAPRGLLTRLGAVGGSAQLDDPRSSAWAALVGARTGIGCHNLAAFCLVQHQRNVSLVRLSAEKQTHVMLTSERRLPGHPLSLTMNSTAPTRQTFHGSALTRVVLVGADALGFGLVMVTTRQSCSICDC